ncbi:MAG: sodium-dependent transporter [Propionibacteriaceae bacterium]|nr:sodium-dependent transporter [Propionibacteriaceae bacterium]
MATKAKPKSTTGIDGRPQWSGQVGFIISAIGSAVGLGNIWRFPGVAYENGGGAFLIPYLVALLTAGIPILFLDYAIGHRFRGSAPLALRRVKRWLETLGWFQVTICVVIAIYYAAILAWAISYFVFSFNQKWGDDTGGFMYGSYLHLADTPGFSFDFVAGVLIPLALVWIAVIVVMALGVAKGVEKANIVFMPTLAIAFLILVIRSVFLPGAKDGLNAFFTPDFSKLGDPDVWIAAYGQIFFSLSIAFGIMITYSSYRKHRANQTTPGLVVGFANSSFELLAGIGVFSIVGFMAHEQNVAVADLSGLKGVSLAFVTFPKVISQMPGSALFGALFFGSLFAAGFTSLTSILQVIMAGIQDKFKVSERNSALMVGVPLAVVSLLFFGTTTGLYVLDVMDNWANNIGIIISAIIMTICVLWVAGKYKELAFHLSSLSTFKVKWTWLVLVGIFSPLLLIYMFGQVMYNLIKSGYDPSSYTRAFEFKAGWLVFILMVAASIVMTFVRWKEDPDKFEAWPGFTGKEF